MSYQAEELDDIEQFDLHIVGYTTFQILYILFLYSINNLYFISISVNGIVENMIMEEFSIDYSLMVNVGYVFTVQPT